MQRLSGLDAVFLNVETDTVPMHVAALFIVDPHNAPGFGFEAVRDMYQRRLHLLPAFRRRAMAMPLNLIHPFWIEDPDFQIDHHFTRTVLPEPGTHAELEKLVGKLFARRLDRSRPLWELHYIEGLASGHIACLLKAHHACFDGVMGAGLFAKVLDTAPDAPEPPPPARPWVPDRIPTRAQMAWWTARSAAGAPWHLFGLLRDTGAELRKMRTAPASPADPAAPAKSAGLPVLAPRTCFNAAITPARSYAFGSLSLNTVKAIKAKYGVTVNDVILAICAEATRGYLLKYGDLPDEPLVAAVPMSVRSKEDDGSSGNRVLVGRVNLATDIVDPVERLLAMSARMHRVKRVHKSLPTKLLMDWINVPLPALLGGVTSLNERLGVQNFLNVPFNLVISNIQGPQEPLYLAGAKMLALYPASIAYHGLGINITLMSYCDMLNVGITAHPLTVPDVDYYLHLMRQALSELKRRAGAADGLNPAESSA
jgi:WS/DGAT/MGAT family acyltransferase